MRHEITQIVDILFREMSSKAQNIPTLKNIRKRGEFNK